MRIIAATDSHYGYIKEHDHHILENLIYRRLGGMRSIFYRMKNIVSLAGLGTAISGITRLL